MLSTVRRAVVVCAVVAAAVATAAPSPASESTTGIRFTVHYQGSFDGSWRSTLTKPIDPVRYRCDGNDSWGTFKSSVRPAKPATITVGSEGGKSFYFVGNGAWRGVVSSARTGEGWLLGLSQGTCVRRPMAANGCSTRTFSYNGVGLGGYRQSWNPVQRVYLDWMLEPEGSHVDCPGGEMGAVHPPEGALASLDMRKLYRCGVRKPRGCKLTIRGQRSYSVNESAGEGQSSTGSGRIEWSATFVSTGRAR